MSDERWRDAAIVAANRVAIFATMFTGTEAQRDRCARRSRSFLARSWEIPSEKGAA